MTAATVDNGQRKDSRARRGRKYEQVGRDGVWVAGCREQGGNRMKWKCAKRENH